MTLILNDTIHKVESIECPKNFSRRNLTDFGVDIMYCKGIGAKVWVRFKTMLANNVPLISEMIESMTASEEMVNSCAEVESILDVNIEPGRSMFYHENCALRVRSAS